MRLNRAVWAIAFLLSTSACEVMNRKHTAESAFEALRRCAANGLQPSDEIVYIGPNNIPIGSIFERRPSGAYDATVSGTSIVGATPSDNVVQRGVVGKCAVDGKKELDLKAAFTAVINPLPASGELGAELKLARLESMTANSFAWDILYKATYLELIDKLPREHAAFREVQRDNRFATVALLKISGYRAALELPAANAASLKVKLKDAKLPKQLTGDLGADVAVTWISENKLLLEVAEATYIAAVFRPFQKGFLRADDGFGASPIAASGVPVRLTPNFTEISR